MSTESEILIVDARAALRRRLADSGGTELSKAFAAWLLGKPETNAEFASIVNEAAAREGAQQDFQTVAILGFAAEAGILGAVQVEALKKGLHRQAGREHVMDGLPVAFCSDAVGILGVALGTKTIGDVNITSQVVRWTSRFLRSSCEMERTEDWQRSLFAVADRQLGSSLNLSIPKSAAVADVRTALVSKGLIDGDDADQVPEDRTQTLKLAMREPQDELNSDRAALRLAAVEWVLGTAEPTVKGKNSVRSAKQSGPLSDRDMRVHDTVSKERFCTLANAEIMKEASVKKRLWADFRLKAGSDAAKRCLDRIRQAKHYPLSREIVKKRSTRQ